jgi:predicted RNase H-like HicB family nuclease
MHAKIKAVIHKAEEGGYWAEVPALPGCVTQAETIAELRRNLQEAVDLYLGATPIEKAPTSRRMNRRKKFLKNLRDTD